MDDASLFDVIDAPGAIDAPYAPPAHATVKAT